MIRYIHKKTLTDGAILTIDFAEGYSQYKVTLGGNRTLSLLNFNDTDVLLLIVYQDATGSRTLTLDGIAVPLNTAPNSATILSILRDSLNNLVDSSAGGSTGVDATAPTVISATATSSTNIRIVFSEAVTATNVGWSFKKNGSANNPTAISGSGTNTLDFTVPTISSGDDVLLMTYAQSTGNTLDSSGNELANITDVSVVNNSGGETLIAFNSLDANVSESPSGTWTASAVEQKMSYTTKRMTADGHVAMDITSGIDASVLGVDSDSVKESWVNGGLTDCQWKVCAFVSSGTLYTAYEGALSSTQINQGSTTGIVKIRLQRTGSTFKLQKSTDGSSFTDIYTFPNTVAGDVYAKGFISISGNKIVNPKKLGFA